MRYPGGKAKTYQHIINHIPPHTVYIEPFLGLGSVMKAKRPAGTEYGIDMDIDVIRLSNVHQRGVEVIHGDGISFLENYSFHGHEVVYCDPPYYPSTRKQKRVYRHDLNEKDHLRFLKVATQLKANVLISGYDNNLYQEYLSEWNKYTYLAKAHNGIREESLWFNYEKPIQLHDYQYLGSNYRERQTISRRIDRLKRRLSELTPQERSLLSDWLNQQEKSDAA